MKNAEKFITHACSYAILILTLLYGFTKLSGYQDTSIAFPSYLIILTFGFVISASEWILSIDRLKAPVRIVIHYVVLLASFSIMYIALMKPNGSGIFMSVVFFTLLYFIFFTVIHFVKKSFNATRKAVGRKSERVSKNPEKKPYKSMFEADEK